MSQLPSVKQFILNRLNDTFNGYPDPFTCAGVLNYPDVPLKIKTKKGEITFSEKLYDFETQIEEENISKLFGDSYNVENALSEDIKECTELSFPGLYDVQVAMLASLVNENNTVVAKPWKILHLPNTCTVDPLGFPEDPSAWGLLYILLPGLINGGELLVSVANATRIYDWKDANNDMSTISLPWVCVRKGCTLSFDGVYDGSGLFLVYSLHLGQEQKDTTTPIISNISIPPVTSLLANDEEIKAQLAHLLVAIQQDPTFLPKMGEIGFIAHGHYTSTFYQKLLSDGHIPQPYVSNFFLNYNERDKLLLQVASDLSLPCRLQSFIIDSKTNKMYPLSTVDEDKLLVSDDFESEYLSLYAKDEEPKSKKNKMDYNVLTIDEYLKKCPLTIDKLYDPTYHQKFSWRQDIQPILHRGQIALYWTSSIDPFYSICPITYTSSYYMINQKNSDKQQDIKYINKSDKINKPFIICPIKDSNDHDYTLPKNTPRILYIVSAIMVTIPVIGKSGVRLQAPKVAPIGKTVSNVATANPAPPPKKVSNVKKKK